MISLRTLRLCGELICNNNLTAEAQRTQRLRRDEMSLDTFRSNRAPHKLPRGGGAIESKALDTVGQS